jgi:DHA2 family multidrug resistance protein
MAFGDTFFLIGAALIVALLASLLLNRPQGFSAVSAPAAASSPASRRSTS